MKTITPADYVHETLSGATFTWVDRGAHIELVNISVPINLQGQGIGTAILRHMKGKRRPLLLVPVSISTQDRTQDLMRFYARAGFTEQYPGSDWLQWKP